MTNTDAMTAAMRRETAGTMADTDTLGLWAIADADPDLLAVVDPEHNRLTFGELAALTNRVSRGLQAAGLNKGDQITTVLPNCFEQLAVCLAAYQSGLYGDHHQLALRRRGDQLHRQ